MRCIPNRCHNLSVVSAERQPLRFSDLLPPAFLFAFGWMAEIVNRSALPEFADEVPASDVALLAVTILPLAFRRRFPLTVLSIVTAAFLVTRFAEVPEFTSTSLTLFIALFAAGAYSRHRMRDWVRGAAIGVPMATVIWGVATSQPDLPDNIALYSVFSVVINSAFFVAGWLMGDLWRKRTEDQAELARRAEMLERQADQLAEQAVASERLRIAQELHDVVAHHVSVMGVQAAAARRSLPPEAQAVAPLLESIEEGGRRAVAEMGRLVGFLRSSEDRSTDPQPTLERVDELVESMRASGLGVELHRVGRPRRLDTAADLAAYRVIQEALTNALKHGSRPEAVVEITYLVDELSIRVRNPLDVRSGNGNGRFAGNGRGLVGMRERVSLSGGRIEAGPRGDGYFEVSATLPYEEAE